MERTQAVFDYFSGKGLSGLSFAALSREAAGWKRTQTSRDLGISTAAVRRALVSGADEVFARSTLIQGLPDTYGHLEVASSIESLVQAYLGAQTYVGLIENDPRLRRLHAKRLLRLDTRDPDPGDLAGVRTLVASAAADQQHLFERMLEIDQVAFRDLDTDIASWPSPDLQRQWLRRCPAGLCFLTYFSSFAGYYWLLGVESEAWVKFRNGSCDESSFAEASILSSHDLYHTEDLYITSFAMSVRGTRLTRYLELALVRQLLELQENGSLARVWAVAATDAGKAFLESKRFMLIQSGAQRDDACDLYRLRLRDLE